VGVLMLASACGSIRYAVGSTSTCVHANRAHCNIMGVTQTFLTGLGLEDGLNLFVWTLVAR
jgi:hypothetical protein